MKKTSSTKISSLIGKGFAHIQDGFDRVCVWGFDKLKKVDTKTAPKNENQIVHGARKVGGFVGEVGTEYFEEYKNLKKEEEEK
jgi:hypothetical protein